MDAMGSPNAGTPLIDTRDAQLDASINQTTDRCWYFYDAGSGQRRKVASNELIYELSRNAHVE